MQIVNAYWELQGQKWMSPVKISSETFLRTSLFLLWLSSADRMELGKSVARFLVPGGPVRHPYALVNYNYVPPVCD